MTLKQFIKENKTELDACIKRVSNVRLNNSDREEWVLNDESLYNWAKSEGVRL